MSVIGKSRFRIVRTLNSPVQAAQRYAVLQPLFRKRWRRRELKDLLNIVRQRPDECNDLDTTRAMVRALAGRINPAIGATL